MRTVWIASLICSLMVLNFATRVVLADQVVMQNGDRYNGRVVSVSATNVVFQSDVLGTVNLSRSKVANLTMGLVTPVTNSVVATPAPKTNVAPDLSAALRQIGSQSNLANQVRAQFLATASPEANQKFDQMLNDLGTGKMSIADLRAQARDAANQLRVLEKEAGEESTGTMGLYLSILDNFLAETEADGPAATNNTAPKKP
ncbi:MAG TPA: hypothetical protein VFZ59_25725 [Verrucomicrobiae bacterium]|nr:hypothetical protein [Verrucomicrobiae bacterium]